MKPFRFGEVVPPEFQCPRPALLKNLISSLKNGQKVLLLGERRMGKTSFLCNVVAPKLKHRLLLVSLWGMKSPEDLSRQLRAALIRLRQNSPLFHKAKRFLASRVSANIDIGVLAAQSLPPIGESSDSLEQLLDEIYAEHNQSPVLAVWDEFQEILKIPDGDAIVGRLRNAIQHHSGMPHVFAGSDRNKMHDIFNNPASPFFKGAATIVFDKIDTADFSAWIKKRFALGKMTLDDDLTDAIFEITDGVSGDVQQLCSALWSAVPEGTHLKRDHLRLALKEIWANESRAYEAVIDEISGAQLKSLKALLLRPELPTTSSEFGKTAGIGAPSSVTRALSALVMKNVLKKTGVSYSFVNPFFAEWLKTKIV